jgi:hypothetical protein
MESTTPATAGFRFEEANVEYVRKNLVSPFKFRMLLMTQLPMGWLAGLRIAALDRKTCKVTVKYKWLNKNPFRSTFWAVLGMAAEMSSGVFIMMYTYKTRPSVATLVVENSAKYYKKAVGKITFTCHSGDDIAQAVTLAVDTGQAQTVVCPMQGVDEQGDLVCEYSFTWSFKARSSK